MTEKGTVPTEKELRDVHLAISRYIHRTPVLTSEGINSMVGAELFFKCENFQKTGSFKFRGANAALHLLSDDKLQKGVATHSSGNHGQALAKAAALRGVEAHIVMPSNAPKAKVKAVKAYGGSVHFCNPGVSQREARLNELIAATGATFVHPFNDYSVICGQATCAKELIEDVPELSTIIAPIGGGGLMSGTVLSSRYFSRGIHAVGAEPEQANDAYLSWKTGTLQPQENPDTVADGLRTGLGRLTFPIILDGVERIITVSEKEILSALQLIWERMKIIIEPSCAVPLAAIMTAPEFFKDQRIGVILTGGNVDLKKILRLF